MAYKEGGWEMQRWIYCFELWFRAYLVRFVIGSSAVPLGIVKFYFREGSPNIPTRFSWSSEIF